VAGRMRSSSCSNHVVRENFLRRLFCRAMGDYPGGTRVLPE
jgi:hypothetical protein